MHSRLTKQLAGAAAMLLAGLILFHSTQNSTLYAQVVKAMEKAQTVHATGYCLRNGQMVKANEIWYKRNVGYKTVWDQNGTEHILIDDGQSTWNYRRDQNFAVASKSISTERLPKEITETSRYLENCIKDKDSIEPIDGHPCRLYVGSYLNKPDSTRLMFWIDENLQPRRFEEKVLENNAWKTIEHIEIEYDIEIDASAMKPDFGPGVEIVDEDKILDEHFSLEKTIFTKEEMGLVFAVHQIERCQQDLIFVVSSLRPSQETRNRINTQDPLAQDYGDYQFGSSYERVGNTELSTSYSPVQIAWYYSDGLVIRWTVFIPRGFHAGQVNQCKIELYYLYASGKLASMRKEAGLDDRLRINPIAVLPLPDNAVSLESRLSETYNLMKLLEALSGRTHLQLKSIPFSDEEMEQYIRQFPDSGETSAYRLGDRSNTARLHHGQTQKPGQISFESWLEDRLTYIEECRNQ